MLFEGGILCPFSCSSALVQVLEFGHFCPHDQLIFTVMSADHPVFDAIGMATVTWAQPPRSP